MPGINGTYEGEGTNVASTMAVTANVPDVAAQSSSGTATTTGQGKTAGVTVTRRRQLRVSSESARSAAAISVASTDQVLTNAARGVYISTSGNLVCRLVDDTADVTFTGLLAGLYYPIAVALIRHTNTTCAGLVLY